MKAFVLVIYLVAPSGGAHISTVEFDTVDACQTAAVRATNSDWGWRSWAFCARR